MLLQSSRDLYSILEFNEHLKMAVYTTPLVLLTAVTHGCETYLQAFSTCSKPEPDSH